MDLTATPTPEATLPAAETPIATGQPVDPEEGGGLGAWVIPTVVGVIVVGGGAAAAVLTPRLGRRRRR
ncbi:MAG: hypothetical protein FWE77_05170 [Clostridia bacterium]|nr:hypothetical protein [Clostridia bacterium]